MIMKELSTCVPWDYSTRDFTK